MGVRRYSPGSPRRHNLSIENPNALPRCPVASRLHGDAFLPVSRAHVAHARAQPCACNVYARRTPHVIFFGRRHVRANITAYAYLYGIKNHPSLKMHRPLHSRGVGSSQRDAEAKATRGEIRARVLTLFHLSHGGVAILRKEQQIDSKRCKFCESHRVPRNALRSQIPTMSGTSAKSKIRRLITKITL